MTGIPCERQNAVPFRWEQYPVAHDVNNRNTQRPQRFRINVVAVTSAKRAAGANRYMIGSRRRGMRRRSMLPTEVELGGAGCWIGHRISRTPMSSVIAMRRPLTRCASEIERDGNQLRPGRRDRLAQNRSHWKRRQEAQTRRAQSTFATSGAPLIRPSHDRAPGSMSARMPMIAVPLSPVNHRHGSYR